MNLFLVAIVACTADPSKAQPEKISGLWELHQVETAGGQVDADTVIKQRYPNCTWGRMTWKFEDDHLSVGYDVLCPAGPDPAVATDYYGCQVSARVPATWDPAKGSWHVDNPVAARSRTMGKGDDALSVPTSCEVTVDAGDYPIVRVPKQPWRWEMGTPDGAVYRLRLPESDRPDFVAAIRGTVEGSP
ncbi:MAG: hypothetical protein ABMB14_22890 [Myxococcota bacterium]